MTFRIQSGNFSLNAIAKSKPLGALTLLHGGAGPADPKGEAAVQAMRTLAEITDQVQAQDFSAPSKTLGFAPFLEGHHRVLTRSEKIALYSAKLLEAEPQFNSGLGAAIQADGTIRVSASFME